MCGKEGDVYCQEEVPLSPMFIRCACILFVERQPFFEGELGRTPVKGVSSPKEEISHKSFFMIVKFEGKVRRYSQLQRYAEIGEGLAVPAPMESIMHQLIAHFFLLIIWKRSNRK